MRIDFNFDHSQLSLEIPEKNLLKKLQANPIDQPQNETNAIENALRNPIGTLPLEEIVQPHETIAIITSDVTRPMPSAKVLPPVLKKLAEAGIRKEDIVIVFALGNHRAQTEAEMRKLVGDSVFEQYRCIDSIGEFIHLGTTSNGTPVEIFAPVIQADRRICLGNIEYHYFAGYSGGAKAIMPGVSTYNAIQANHSRMVDPAAAAGRIDGNPVRKDIDTVLDYVPVDFIVNVVLDEKKNIIHCIAGHPIEAHRVGCRLLDDLYGVNIPQQADIVIVSPGGYPKDINLYQAQKALDNAKHAVRKGGAILWLASAKEGLGEDHFEHWMLGHEKPADMIEHIQREFILGGHKAAAIAMVMENADIYLYSDLEADFVRKLHFHPVSDPQDCLNQLLTQYGNDATVIAMPYGGATLPLLTKK